MVRVRLKRDGQWLMAFFDSIFDGRTPSLFLVIPFDSDLGTNRSQTIEVVPSLRRHLRFSISGQGRTSIVSEQRVGQPALVSHASHSAHTYQYMLAAAQA